MNRREKLSKRFLDALDPVVPKGRPGKLISTPSVLTRKDRRNKARRTPGILKGIPVKELIEEGLEPLPIYDEWHSKRDGMFTLSFDKHFADYHYRKCPKVKKQIAIRKFRRKFYKQAHTSD